MWWLQRLYPSYSWQIVQPNSVVWTWSDSFAQKLQDIRVWVLLLLLVNSLWGYSSPLKRSVPTG